MVRDARLFTLEDAIRKMTSLSADTFGLQGRGRLIEKACADVVVFDENTIADQAQFGDPIHHCSGVEHVLINGVQVVADGTPLNLTAEESQIPGHRL